MSYKPQKFVLSSPVSETRRILKHSMLGNQVCLPKNPEDLKRSLLYEDTGTPLHEQLFRKALELLELMGDPNRGYSPAQLLGGLAPFNSLAKELRINMQNKIHKRFIEEFELSVRKNRIRVLVDDLQKAMNLFLVIQEADLTLLQQEMIDVQNAAKALITELDTLPKGIWLWKIEPQLSGVE